MTTQADMSPSVVLFALRRGGSSITGRLLQLVLAGAGFQLVDEGKRYYQAGYMLDEIPRSFFDALAPQGSFYGPFRSYPLTMRLSNLSALTRIVVVRDPRDCLVSAYFAERGPHDRAELHRAVERLPTQRDVEESIDDFCMQAAEPMRRQLDSLRLLCLHYPDTLVFRYEDIFRDPIGWLRGMIDRLGVQVAPEALDQARVEAVFLPDGEDASRHHRQGLPGDHHRKLRRQTSLFLGELFAPQLTFFGYGGALAPLALPVPAPERAAETVAVDADEIASLKRVVSELQRENGFRIREITTLRDALRPVAALRETMELLAAREAAETSDFLYQ